MALQSLELTTGLLEHLVGLAVAARTQVGDGLEVARAARRGLAFDGRLVADLEASGLAREAVQAAAGLVDDLGRRVHALALREGQLLAHDGHSLGRRDLEDEVDGGPQIEVEFGGQDALHRSILACPIGCSVRRSHSLARTPARTAVRSRHCRGRHPIARNVTYPLCMHAHGRPRARRPWLPIVGAALAVAVVCAVAAWRPWVAPSAPAAGSRMPRPSSAVAPAPLALPEQPARADLRRLLGLRLRRDRADARLRVRARRDARAGTPSSTASAAAATSSPAIDGGSYGERIAALDPALDPDLVIVEGSINDRRLPAEGYRDAVTAAWDALARALPRRARSSSSARPRRCCPSKPPPRASTRTWRDLAAAPRLVVHLADRRGLDHRRQLPRRHRHRHRPQPPVDRGPRLPRRPDRRRRSRRSPRERMSSPTPRSTRSSSDPERGRRPAARVVISIGTPP